MLVATDLRFERAYGTVWGHIVARDPRTYVDIERDVATARCRFRFHEDGATDAWAPLSHVALQDQQLWLAGGASEDAYLVVTVDVSALDAARLARHLRSALVGTGLFDDPVRKRAVTSEPRPKRKKAAANRRSRDSNGPYRQR